MDHQRGPALDYKFGAALDYNVRWECHVAQHTPRQPAARALLLELAYTKAAIIVRGALRVAVHALRRGRRKAG